MALGSCMIIALATCIFIVTCAGYETEESTTAVTESSSDGSSVTVQTYSRSRTSIGRRKKCKRVRRCPKNEEFLICTQSLHRAQYCSQKGQPLRQHGDSKCTKGCICKEGFLRNNTGICVPESQCNQNCGQGEVLRKCPADCASDYCPTEDGKTPSCRKPEQGQCPPPVCKCGFNRRRAANGTCISTRDCPPFDCSARPNEEFDPCPPLCPSDDCSQASPSGECPSRFGHILIVLRCNPSCRCINGYWRKNGICVPYEECNEAPKQCSSNEEVRCVNICPPEKTCNTRNIEFDCLASDKPCENKCVCKEGYFRNSLGTCISEAQCDLCSKPNEFYDCGSACDNKCSTLHKENRTNCPILNIVCNRKCYCEDGFARDADDNCIPVDECLKTQPTCGKNEVLDECPTDCASDYCPKCEDDNKKCPKPDTCPSPKCKCQFNYRRDENGSCIPTEDCPPFDCSDKPNEQWTPCPPICPSDSCSLSRATGVCPFRIGTRLECNPKCQCKEDYGRTEDGTCVPLEECPGLCPINEEYNSCTQAICRQENCSTRNDPVKCPRIDPAFCKKGCVCKENYYRDENGTCVTDDQCTHETPKQCSSNEEVRCVNICPPEKTCNTRNIEFDCAASDKPCENKCVCKEGYFRNSLGTCISEAQCDLCSKPNEFYDCGSACDNKCSTLHKENRTNCPIVNIVCNRKCYCEDGFARDADDNCIPVDECPKTQPTCGKNEVLDECPTDCASDYCPTCEDGNKKCPKPDTCPPPKCKCQFNYRRDENGSCIPTEDCPRFDCNDKPNEQWTPCPPICPSDSCSLSRATGVCPFRIGSRLECNPKCQCKEDYGRTEDGTCVPLEECPGLCPINEEYNSCTQAICRQENCSTRNDPVKCPRIDPAFCKKGCVCKENYYRDENGTCVTDDQCTHETPKQCSSNEEVRCVNICPPEKTCNTRNIEFDCLVSDKPCENKCVCKEGYFRNSLGTCISEAQCDLCSKPNEFYDCGSACDNKCSTLHKENRTNCPIVNIVCNRKCYCEDGFARDADDNCIPVDECPKTQPTCGKNEVLDECPTDCASDYCPKCEDDNKKCPKPDTFPPPKCKCQFNYRRDENGSCIPTEDCPPFDCSDKPNEQWSPCPPICPSDSCSLSRATGVCPFRIGIILECNPKCQCKEDYGRTEDGTCVPFEECPDICPINEEYNSCTQAICRQENCSTRNDPVGCPRVDPAFCKKGCVCKEYYYRNENGTCVPEDQCTQTQPTCGDNEVLDDCPADCASDHCPTCEEDNKKCSKPDKCPPPACKCEFNYRRAENGTCIPTEDCPPFDCNAEPNEQWTPCPPICPSDSCGLPRVTGVCPFRIGIRLECNPKCQCKADYGRTKDGTCVPLEDCPGFCPINEEYNSCTQAICRQENCSTRNDPVLCPRVIPAFCKKGCVCKEHYYRNENGTCVPEDQCPDQPELTCDDDEILVKCPSDCPSDYCPKCEDDNKKCPQPKNCPPPACKCRFNYRRADNGTCIPTTDCPPFDCSAKPNEKYTPCPFLCPTDECSWPWIRKKCPFRIGIRLECHPKCQCKENYGRVNGTCVPFKKCPNLCPANEEYNSCTQALCRPQNCSNKDDPVPCPMVETSSCNKGCVCKENYYRDNEGACVEDEECPDPRCPNPHEEYKTSLIPNCPLLGTCKSIVARIRCEEPEAPGCICKSGYMRSVNQTSPCIPQCECKEIANTPECQKTD